MDLLILDGKPILLHAVSIWALKKGQLLQVERRKLQTWLWVEYLSFTNIELRIVGKISRFVAPHGSLSAKEWSVRCSQTMTHGSTKPKNPPGCKDLVKNWPPLTVGVTVCAIQTANSITLPQSCDDHCHLRPADWRRNMRPSVGLLVAINFFYLYTPVSALFILHSVLHSMGCSNRTMKCPQICKGNTSFAVT